MELITLNKQELVRFLSPLARNTYLSMLKHWEREILCKFKQSNTFVEGKDSGELLAQAAAAHLKALTGQSLELAELASLRKRLCGTVCDAIPRRIRRQREPEADVV
jgi:hypothetical protein